MDGKPSGPRGRQRAGPPTAVVVAAWATVVAAAAYVVVIWFLCAHGGRLGRSSCGLWQGHLQRAGGPAPSGDAGDTDSDDGGRGCDSGSGAYHGVAHPAGGRSPWQMLTGGKGTPTLTVAAAVAAPPGRPALLAAPWPPPRPASGDGLWTHPARDTATGAVLDWTAPAVLFAHVHRTTPGGVVAASGRKGSAAIRAAKADLSAVYGRARPAARHASGSTLRLFTTGVGMGKFQRNWTVAGCLAGGSVYPLSLAANDDYSCELPAAAVAALCPGTPLSVALVRDAALAAAAEGAPVALSIGLTVRVSPAALRPLPAGVDVTPGVGAGALPRIGEGATPQLLPPPLPPSGLAVLSAAVGWGGLRTADVAPADAPGRPRYAACLCTMIKGDAAQAPDWVDYHRRLGFDAVYIMDNSDGGDDPALWAAFGRRPDVVLVRWPWVKSQTQGYSWFLTAARERCEWVAFMDVDNWLLLGVDDLLPRLPPQQRRRFFGMPFPTTFALHGAFTTDVAVTTPVTMLVQRLRRDDLGQAHIPFFSIGSSGHVRQPAGAVPENFVDLPPKLSYENVKSLCATDASWATQDVHRCLPPPGGWVHEAVWKTTNETAYPTASSDAPVIVHYNFQSWEHFAKKAALSTASNTDGHSVVSPPPRDGGGRLPVDAAPKGWVVNTTGGGAYTHFRDVRRRVLRQLPATAQRVVTTRGEGADGPHRRRCVQRWLAPAAHGTGGMGAPDGGPFVVDGPEVCAEEPHPSAK